jgi:hypothetical protein
VLDLIKTGTPSGRVSLAFTLVLEGLSQYVYQNYLTANPDTALFAFTGSLLSAGGIKISPTNPGSGTIVTPVAQYEDQSNLRGPQRISFSYDITFSNNSAFPGVGGTNPFDLNAQVQFESIPLLGASASQEFELFGGEDPYFSNRDPSNGAQLSWFSQELQSFRLLQGLPLCKKLTQTDQLSLLMVTDLSKDSLDISTGLRTILHLVPRIH